ncbi:MULTISPECIES: SDR family NAD(P)-dependent oxidoreductase [unclassified Coleofasciculus]|uniref:SDR family NAD(P)-dependent oxidoreductase n=1 Tax=unclassified Coleofasciculus TaxID=2692782 RepID=UPI001880F5C7|nr:MULTISPECIES: SDR family NAD(P)-dependent oxidoreductase [unclassified Coleofasciculus]MBE9125526.1 SDR family NAD(P)-dependent oxidoreductase [Coleofasciculus sp. LEGE 07081]MBE9148610.1 SDR family NAD(P)-dependent oxidoreductase [Coleofasciculus sp. LEGE 07092]
MSLKTRLKAALHSFLNPNLTPKVVIQSQAPEPSQVLDNQLLAGKNVLITGAGQNIGKSIALEMAKQEANVFFTDIVLERCEKLEQELTIYPVQSKGFVADISNTEDTDFLYSLLVQDNIYIDVLVNNVGIQFTKIGLNNLELSEWHKTFNTNVFGSIYLTKLIAQMMIDNSTHGSIIFMTSMHQNTVVRWPSYSSSKAALDMIIKELAIDLSSHQIRVNGIAPGWVIEDEQGNPLYHKYAPLYGSSINPRYIGRAAVYLASDYFSKFTTGTLLRIDGGLSLYNYRVAQHPPQLS